MLSFDGESLVGVGVSMNRQMVLKVAVAVVGVLFVLSAYPMLALIRQEPATSMMLSVYATLGVFLLLALRQPSEHRSLMAFTAWSSLAHAVLMGTQVLRGIVARSESIGVAVFFVIGVVLLVLTQTKRVEP